MSGSPELREACAGDAEQLCRLFALLDHHVDPDIVRRNLEAMNAVGDVMLVAADGAALVGACGVQWSVHLHRAQPVGRITILVVAEEQRGSGLGRVLVAEAEKRLAAAGCGLVEVTSNERLTAAHAFYRHLGYERTSLRFAKSLGSG